MKLFCSYAHTGEDIDEATRRMRLVVDTLNGNGHDAYCNLFDEKIVQLQVNDDITGIFQGAFDRVRQSDAMVAIIASPRRSIGQIMEIGVALDHNKPVYLLEHQSAEGSSYISRLVDRHFQWNDESELELALAKI